MRCAVIAIALTPTMSRGRPGVCTSPAEIMVVTPPLRLESIQPSWFWRGVQSPATGWTWLSMRPGASVVPLASMVVVAPSSVEIPGAADRGDPPADGDERIGIEDRTPDIAREQEADVPDDELVAGARHRACLLGHRCLPGSAPAYEQARRMQ